MKQQLLEDAKSTGSAVSCVGFAVLRDLFLRSVADGMQHCLAKDRFVPLRHVVLEVTGEHDRVDPAGLLAESAVDALERIDVVPRRPPRPADSIVIASAGQTASQSLQTMHRSSPLGYRRSASMPRKRGGNARCILSCRPRGAFLCRPPGFSQPTPRVHACLRSKTSTAGGRVRRTAPSSERLDTLLSFLADRAWMNFHCGTAGAEKLSEK